VRRRTLFITRPWSQLVPELADWHVERFWVLAVITVVVGSGSLRLRPSLQTTSVICLLAAMGLSSLCALDGSAAWDRLYDYIALVLLYFALVSVIRTPYQLLFFATCYIVVMAAYLGKAEYEYFVHGAKDHTMGVSRLIGIETSYGHPNGVAASTVLSLPILYCLWKVRKPFTETWPRICRIWFPRCLVLYFLLATTAVILTNSRSGMLGFAGFVFLTAITGRKLRGKVIGFVAAAILLAATWMTMPEESKNRLRTVWDPSAGPSSAYASGMGRIEGMKAGFEIFQRFPIAGVGLGNFLPYRVAEVDGTALDAHSLVGQMLGETGLMGAGAFLLLLVAVFANWRRTVALANRNSNVTLQLLSRLADACRNAVLLLLFFGLFSHNMTRFNWLCLAAFALLCRVFAERVCADGELVETEVDERRGIAMGSTCA